MVHLGTWQQPMLLEYPIRLFLLTPHHIPVISLYLFPLSCIEALVDAIAERGFEFDVASISGDEYGGVG
jgi:hypothetical protein